MAELKTALDTTVNCCNGRVGRRAMELAAQDERMKFLAMPTGVDADPSMPKEATVNARSRAMATEVPSAAG